MTAVATAPVGAATRTTITEALSEVKMIGQRIAKRREGIMPYLSRQRAITDPLAEAIEGGSPAFVERERQAVADLEQRLIRIRRAIMQANLAHTLVVDGEERAVYDWLTWRREVVNGQRTFLQSVRARLQQVRTEAQRQMLGVVNVSVQDKAQYTDVLITVDEAELANETDHVEKVLGMLDGQLQLFNATTFIDVA